MLRQIIIYCITAQEVQTALRDSAWEDYLSLFLCHDIERDTKSSKVHFSLSKMGTLRLADQRSKYAYQRRGKLINAKSPPRQ